MNLGLLHVYLFLLGTFGGPANCELSPGSELLASDLNRLVDTHPSLWCVVWIEWLKQHHTMLRYALNGQKCVYRDLEGCQYTISSRMFGAAVDNNLTQLTVKIEACSLIK